MTEINRVMIPEDRELGINLIEPNHRIEIRSKELSFDTIELQGNDINWENHDREHLETESAVCSCGESFKGISEAEDHLQNPQNPLEKSTVREKLEDIAIHGFEFNGFEGHGTSMVWQNQEYAFKLYATPSEWLTDEEDGVMFQLQGGMDTPFDQMNGMNGERQEFENGLTLRQYVKMVRDYIEDNLLTSKWYEVESETYELRWDNEENKCFSLVIKELEDDQYDYGIFEVDGIQETLMDRGDRTECVQKSIVYRRENPLGKVMSFKSVIEDSDHTFRGEV